MRKLALAAGVLGFALQAHAGPDPGGALRALGATPLRVGGDLIAAAGLVAASSVGLVGDGLSLLDANRITRPVLSGFASGIVRQAALGLSQGATGALEGLRAEDIERLPEPREAYLDNAPGAGRLDTVLTGLGSLQLALEDALTGPALAVLRAAGAKGPASAVSGWSRDERIRVLGPLVRESSEEAE